MFRASSNCGLKFYLVALFSIVGVINTANAEIPQTNKHQNNKEHKSELYLSKSQLDEYFTNGILVIPKFFSKDEVVRLEVLASRLEKEAEQLAHSEKENEASRIMFHGTQFVIDSVNNNVRIHRIVWAGAAEPELLSLSRQTKLLAPVAQILGTDHADHLINQLHYKRPSDGIKFAWRQYVGNRREFDPKWQDLNGKGSFVQAVIAIDPMTSKNGPICYVPGSHIRGDLFLDIISDPEELREIAQLDEAVPLILKPGDLALIHPYLVHGSKTNESSIARRVLINGFAYPGCNKQPYPGQGSALSIALK